MFEAALVTVLQSTAFGTSWMIWREETRILTFQMRRTFTCRSRSHIDKWNLFFFKGAHNCKKENNTFFFSVMLFCHLQLEEANTLLRAEAEAATRLRKTQTESSKQLQQLEANVRELQDKCCLLERSKLSLEKECISLQAALETERREHSQGSETISDLMGRWHSNKWCLSQELKELLF